MPYIQCEFQEGLSKQQKERLANQIVKVVNASIGSSIPHINVVIREWPGQNLVEAGEHDRDFKSTQADALVGEPKGK